MDTKIEYQRKQQRVRELAKQYLPDNREEIKEQFKIVTEFMQLMYENLLLTMKYMDNKYTKKELIKLEVKMMSVYEPAKNRIKTLLET